MMRLDLNNNLGSNFDDFLKEEGLLEEVNKKAIKRILYYQKEQEKKLKIEKIRT
jgi:antitoxin HicB